MRTESVVAQPMTASRSPATPATASRVDIEIGVLDRMIAERKRSLSMLKQRRKRLINMRTFERARADPEFQAKRVAGLRRGLMDPVAKAEFIARLRASQRRTGRALPDMTPDQKIEYRRLRHKMSRADALKLVFG